MSNQDDYDFGFEFADDMTEAVDTAQTKAQQIYDAIMPLLTNLKMNPEKPNIVWPDRVKKIDNFIKKLDNILKS
jgi:hypothetical protein